jgi:hypothetical protein
MSVSHDAPVRRDGRVDRYRHLLSMAWRSWRTLVCHDGPAAHRAIRYPRCRVLTARTDLARGRSPYVTMRVTLLLEIPVLAEDVSAGYL